MAVQTTQDPAPAALLTLSALAVAHPLELAQPIALALFYGFSTQVWHARKHWTRSRAFGVANTITALRALAVIGTLFVGNLSPVVLVWVFALCLLMDGIDGWLARRLDLDSSFGAEFDCAADAALVLAVSVAATWLHDGPSWWLLPGMLRYLLLVNAAGQAPPGITQSRSERLWARWAYAAAVSALIASLLVPTPVAYLLLAAVTAALLSSFATDFRHLWRQPTVSTRWRDARHLDKIA